VLGQHSTAQHSTAGPAKVKVLESCDNSLSAAGVTLLADRRKPQLGKGCC
jgi:hypothetical protein